MSDVKRAMKHEMDRIIAEHGHAAPILHLAALVGWQGRWAHAAMAPHVAKVAALLAEAAELMGKIEADEAEERKAIRAQHKRSKRP